MLRALVVALLAASVALAAPVPKAEKKQVLYYPVEVGAVRVMELSRGGPGVETTETVTKVEEKDGVYTVTTETRLLDVTRPGEVYRVSAGGLSCKPASEPKDGFDTLLKAGAKAGDTWTVEPKKLLKYSYTMGGEEEVEVPAGKYKAVRVDVVISNGGTGYKQTVWYAEGVGLVKQIPGDDKTDHVLKLKSFTPGKGEAKAEPKKDE